ncbi:hypothetical protein [uncultured Tenacibaculum sp.]|uniref:hypothetical protein n=1 Tax=uncultured Tenacibaculum sp. TaxID=174713 RepID=UPI0026379E3B|nr:hypothetical protein [uncultured Tenacibaculum sp.]
MPSYNPNTKYGRRKNREEFQRNYNNKTEEEKRKLDQQVGCARFVLFIIAMIVCFVIIALGGKIK